MNFGSIARREYSGRAITLGSVLLCADYLDLHVGQQGRQRPQGGQHRRYDGDRPADDHPGGEGHLHEHLVLLVADYEAAYVPLFDELLGPIDQVARGDLDMLGKGMFVLLGGVVHLSGLFAYRQCYSVLVIRFLCPSQSLPVWPSSPRRLDRSSETEQFGCRLHHRPVRPTGVCHPSVRSNVLRPVTNAPVEGLSLRSSAVCADTLNATSVPGSLYSVSPPVY